MTETLTQQQARDAAREWNTEHPDSDRVAVACQDPPGSWGGQNIGWTVIYPFRKPASPTGFTGTWVSTPVTELRPDDQVQWRSGIGTIQSVGVDRTTGTVTIVMTRTSPTRRSTKTLPIDTVLLTQRPAP